MNFDFLIVFQNLSNTRLLITSIPPTTNAIGIHDATSVDGKMCRKLQYWRSLAVLIVQTKRLKGEAGQLITHSKF